MSSSSRGSAFERVCKADLEDKGYLVTRSAGSHGAADLVALYLRNQNGRTPILSPFELASARIPLLVQCKKDGECGPKEWNALYELALQTRSCPILAESVGKPAAIAYWVMSGKKDGFGGAQPRHRAPWDL